MTFCFYLTEVQSFSNNPKHRLALLTSGRVFVPFVMLQDEFPWHIFDELNLFVADDQEFKDEFPLLSHFEDEFPSINYA